MVVTFSMLKCYSKKNLRIKPQKNSKSFEFNKIRAYTKFIDVLVKVKVKVRRCIDMSLIGQSAVGTVEV